MGTFRIVGVVRDFVDREVRPVARGLEHEDTYPEKLVEQMKELGIFGLAVPAPWGEAKPLPGGTLKVAP